MPRRNLNAVKPRTRSRGSLTISQVTIDHLGFAHTITCPTSGYCAGHHGTVHHKGIDKVVWCSGTVGQHV